MESLNIKLKYFLFLLMKQTLSLDERVESVSNKEEENIMVDKAIGIYINDMIKHSLKVYSLSLALSERDPSSAFETI
jgi:hypothetical protein